jgi:hypothetical protein
VIISLESLINDCYEASLSNLFSPPEKSQVFPQNFHIRFFIASRPIFALDFLPFNPSNRQDWMIRFLELEAQTRKRKQSIDLLLERFLQVQVGRMLIVSRCAASEAGEEL